MSNSYPGPLIQFMGGSNLNVYTFWEDFGQEYVITSNLIKNAAGEWMSTWRNTALSSGTFAMSTDEKFGVAVLGAATTTDNSGMQLQCDMETFSLNAGKETGFLTRAKMSDGTQDEFLAGLCITDTTLIDGGGTLAAVDLTFTDGIGVYKPDGETNIYGFVMRDSVLLATGAKGYTPTDYNKFGFKVFMDPSTAGKGRVEFYLNDAVFGVLNSETMPYDSEEILTPSIAMNSGDASGTKTCTVDYVGAYQQR